MDRSAPPGTTFRPSFGGWNGRLPPGEAGPLSALFRGGGVPPMFDIDVKNGGLVHERHPPRVGPPHRRHAPGILPELPLGPGRPVLVCSSREPGRRRADVCGHCSSSSTLRGDVRCLKCRKGRPWRRRTTRSARTSTASTATLCRAPLQPSARWTGRIVATGRPRPSISQMLLIREALVQKIVCMGTDERRGLDELQTHLRHCGREDLRVGQDGGRPVHDGARDE